MHYNAKMLDFPNIFMKIGCSVNFNREIIDMIKYIIT